MEELDNKSMVLMPMMFSCELTIGQRLVLAYGLFQQQYGQEPSDMRYHNHTGLARATVASVRAVLDSGDWWKRYLDYTKPAKNEFGYQYYRCYIHQPGQRQTVASVALWSLLHHMGEKGIKQKYNYTYFASSLGFTGTTAKNCLDSLKADRWLDYEAKGEGRRQLIDFRRYRLTESQLASLRSKGEMKEAEGCSNELCERPESLNDNAQPVILHTTTEGSTNANDETESQQDNRPEFINYLRRIIHETERFEYIARKVREGKAKFYPQAQWADTATAIETAIYGAEN